MRLVSHWFHNGSHCIDILCRIEYSIYTYIIRSLLFSSYFLFSSGLFSSHILSPSQSSLLRLLSILFSSVLFSSSRPLVSPSQSSPLNHPCSYRIFSSPLALVSPAPHCPAQQARAQLFNFSSTDPASHREHVTCSPRTAKLCPWSHG